MITLRTFAFALLTLSTIFVGTAAACLWGYDTLRDERRGLPGIAEILAGKWERHSPFFYEERVRRMKELLSREPNNLEAFDNLAVAYEKLGQIDKAIETILAKDKLKPGEYTTHANLGTFYLHAGKLEEGIAEIRKALEINPDAHFGREKYQLKVAEYLLEAKQSGKPPTMSFVTLRYPERPATTSRPAATSPADVEVILAENRAREPERRKAAAESKAIHAAWVADRDRAIEGVVGMIRFGTGTSPHLYAALGELLESRGDHHLAYRAFKRATEYDHADTEWITQQLNRAKDRHKDQSEFSDEVIERERQAASTWVAAYQTFEDDLLRAGKDPSDESLYAPFYAKHGSARESIAPSVAEKLFRGSNRSRVGILVTVGLIIVGVPIVTLFAIRRLRVMLGLPAPLR